MFILKDVIFNYIYCLLQFVSSDCKITLFFWGNLNCNQPKLNQLRCNFSHLNVINHQRVMSAVQMCSLCLNTFVSIYKKWCLVFIQILMCSCDWLLWLTQSDAHQCACILQSNWEYAWPLNLKCGGSLADMAWLMNIYCTELYCPRFGQSIYSTAILNLLTFIFI